MIKLCYLPKNSMTLKEFKSKEMDINYIYCRVFLYPLVRAKKNPKKYTKFANRKKKKNNTKYEIIIHKYTKFYSVWSSANIMLNNLKQEQIFTFYKFINSFFRLTHISKKYFNLCQLTTFSSLLNIFSRIS